MDGEWLSSSTRNSISHGPALRQGPFCRCCDHRSSSMYYARSQMGYCKEEIAYLLQGGVGSCSSIHLASLAAHTFSLFSKAQNGW